MATVRLSVTVSKNLDRSVRDFLEERGRSKGDLSRFVEDAVRRQLFKSAAAETRAAKAHIAQPELEAANEEAIVFRNTA